MIEYTHRSASIFVVASCFGTDAGLHGRHVFFSRCMSRSRDSTSEELFFAKSVGEVLPRA